MPKVEELLPYQCSSPFWQQSPMIQPGELLTGRSHFGIIHHLPIPLLIAMPAINLLSRHNSMI
jgi:hypothetical protein